jgi:hypothetical protein
MTLIEIRDATESGYLSVELIDLLKVVEPVGNTLVWSILEIEATGDLSEFGLQMLSLERMVESSEHGFFIDWTNLIILARLVDQIVNLTLVGCDSLEQLLKLRLGVAPFSEAELVIEMIDSSLWSVYTRDIELQSNLLLTFKNTKLLG